MREPYVPRNLTVTIRDSTLIKVIIGPRRSGKSFLAMHIIGRKSSCGYVNFDDERFVGIKNYDDIIAAIDSKEIVEWYGTKRNIRQISFSEFVL